MFDAAASATEPDLHNPAEQIEALREEIRRHDYQYYVMDAPSIPDSEYDKLFRQLQTLEQDNPDLITPDSPTQRVGGKPLKAFDSVTHRVAMLSLNNAFEEGEVAAFDRRVRESLGQENIEYAVEPKFDGLAITLTYERGVLVQGATRGDGYTGEDVTDRVRGVDGLPESAGEGDYEVRGELYLNDENKAKANAIRAKAKQQRFHLA